ncbi:hypothetical protein [Ammoniphilus resinae]|uniref:PurR-regulated permease PerM n=1 Tax=Ammoniphilus resinae TaxID=861532 RepID=A0ABS4GRN4_9BACL|nr:hypothetical protein [Ammoniphilus resinae]MBP1932942.1 putative PurR-regulated permease PerM [Ammoniphilus resinae]
MKKSTKVLVVAGVVTVIFGFGTVVGSAASDWITQVIGDANTRLTNKKAEKVYQLVDRMQEDVSNAVQIKTSNIIAEKEDYIEAELQRYYDEKINNATNTPEFQQAQEEIDSIVDRVIEEGKSYLDKQFAGN